MKDHLSSDYYYAGTIAGISVVQSGRLPNYLSKKQLHEIFFQDGSCVSKSVLEFRCGLDQLGINTFSQHFTQFIDIFHHQHKKLTVKSLIHLLQPQFSEEGSNKLRYEKIVYNKFVKYVREAASDHCIATLEDILVFVTCVDEVPILGFSKQPVILFPEVSLPNVNNTEHDKVLVL